MGSLFDVTKNIFQGKQESEEEKEYFNKMKIGLQKSIHNIDNTLKPINNWDELLQLNTDIELYDQEKEELNKENKLRRAQQSIKKPIERNRIISFYSFWSETCTKCNNTKCCRIFYLICGFFFCIIQLMGVQEGIIILNALLREIVDEIKLSRNIPKVYNFYEQLEIASYKSMPEIDVGMFWSFIGIIVLKKYGFIWSNIFQFLSLIGFILLFLLFDFHEGEKLLVYYTRMETAALVISYIFLCISVGASSTIALKQLFNLYKVFYQKEFNFFKYINIIYCIIRCLKPKSNIKNSQSIGESQSKSNNNKNTEENSGNPNNGLESNKNSNNNSNESESSFDFFFHEIYDKEYYNIFQLFFFYNFSKISLFFVILLNRLIFKSVENISSIWVLKFFIIVYTSCFCLNLLFYCFYSIPLINNELKKHFKKKLKEFENNKKKFQ